MGHETASNPTISSGADALPANAPSPKAPIARQIDTAEEKTADAAEAIEREQPDTHTEQTVNSKKLSSEIGSGGDNNGLAEQQQALESRVDSPAVEEQAQDGNGAADTTKQDTTAEASAREVAMEPLTQVELPPDTMDVDPNLAADEAQSPPGLTDALEAALDQMLPADPAPPAPGDDGEIQATDGAVNGSHEEGGEAEWEEDSDPYDSSDSSSSSSSSDDDSEDDEQYPLMGAEETAKLLMALEGDGDEDGEKTNTAARGHIKTKNESNERPLPKPTVTITPEMRIEPVGKITSIVENILVIKSSAAGEVQVLDTGSVLCKEDRSIIAALSDTIGSVRDPAYAVVFESEEEIKELGLSMGMTIFYSVQHANYVFTKDLKAMKGSDASNINDEEVAGDELEFSDDEKEQEYKRNRKASKRGGRGGRGGNDFGPHPLRQEVEQVDSLMYDEGEGDLEDGPYKPLARPAAFAQGVPESLPAIPPMAQDFNFDAGRGGREFRGGRGRGRGDSRGGRGRGRGDHRGGRSGRDRQQRNGYGDSQSYSHDRRTSVTSNGYAPTAASPQGSPTVISPPLPQGQGQWQQLTAQYPHVPPPPPPPSQYAQGGQVSPPAPPNFNFKFQSWNAGQRPQPHPPSPAYPPQPYAAPAPPPRLPNGFGQAPPPPPIWSQAHAVQAPVQQNGSYGQMHDFYAPPPPPPHARPGQQLYPQHGAQQPYQQQGQPPSWWSQGGADGQGR
jgi:H/ACA ribonucleoprotein complex non-core subunit NAF1